MNKIGLHEQLVHLCTKISGIPEAELISKPDSELERIIEKSAETYFAENFFDDGRNCCAIVDYTLTVREMYVKRGSCWQYMKPLDDSVELRLFYYGRRLSSAQLFV